MTEVTNEQLDAIIENKAPEVIPEEVVEEVAEEVNETEEVVEEESQEEEAPVEEQPKERKKTTYKDDMLKERRKRQEVEARLSETEQRYQMLEKWVQENADKLTGKTFEQVQNMFDDAVDGEHLQAIDEKVSNVSIEARIIRDEARGYAKYGTSLDDAKQALALFESQQLMAAAQAAGRPITETEAANRVAKQAQAREIALAKEGINIADFTMNQAIALANMFGIKPTQQKSGVNLDAVNRAQKAAGMPAVKRSGGDSTDYSLEAQLKLLEKGK